MKKVLFLLFMAVLIPALIFAAKSEEDQYLNAMDSYNKQDLPKAMSGFKDFLAAFPQSKYRPAAMMKVAEMEENFTSKKELYEKVINEYPGTENEAEAVYSTGRLYHARGDFKKAEEYMETLIRKFSNTVWIEPAYYYLMISLEDMGRFDEAKAIYNDYNSGKGYYMYKNRVELAYANLLFKTGEFGKAADSFEKVISKYDDNEKYIYLPPVYKRLALAYAKMNLPEKAKDTLMELNKKFPDAESDTFEAKNADTEGTVSGQAAADAVTQPAENVAGSFFAVQVGAFSNQKYIKVEKEKYSKMGISVLVKKSGKLSRVMVGKFNSKAEAEKFAIKENIKNFFVKEIQEGK
jgi:TolA-binding protein